MRDRLAHISRRTGLPSGNLVRRAVEEYLDHIESAGNISIPIATTIVAEQAAVYGSQIVNQGSASIKRRK